MDILSYLRDNLAEVTIITGLILLIVEIWVLGLSTIVLLALGVSTVLTGILVWMGIIPETVIFVIAFSGIGAGVLTGTFWLPLKKMQRSETRIYNIHSDFVGLIFEVDARLDALHPGHVKYSGVSWKLVLGANHRDAVIEIGNSVKVVSVDVGKFTVEPSETSKALDE